MSNVIISSASKPFCAACNDAAAATLVVDRERARRAEDRIIELEAMIPEELTREEHASAASEATYNADRVEQLEAAALAALDAADAGPACDGTCHDPTCPARELRKLVAPADFENPIDQAVDMPAPTTSSRPATYADGARVRVGSWAQQGGTIAGWREDIGEWWVQLDDREKYPNLHAFRDKYMAPEQIPLPDRPLDGGWGTCVSCGQPAGPSHAGSPCARQPTVCCVRCGGAPPIATLVTCQNVGREGFHFVCETESFCDERTAANRSGSDIRPEQTPAAVHAFASIDPRSPEGQLRSVLWQLLGGMGAESVESAAQRVVHERDAARAERDVKPTHHCMCTWTGNGDEIYRTLQPCTLHRHWAVEFATKRAAVAEGDRVTWGDEGRPGTVESITTTAWVKWDGDASSCEHATTNLKVVGS